MLPRKIGMLKSLKELIISGCSNLDGLPLELRKMDLKVLHADGIPINQLLSTTEEVKPWLAFIWYWVSKPRKNPEISWASLPCSLVSLSLEDCNLYDDDFPRDLSILSKLQNLNLSKNPICNLPDCIRGLTTLKKLRLNSCTRLQSILGLPNFLELYVGHCTSLEKITKLSASSKIKLIEMTDCRNLVEIEGSFKFQAIGNIDAEMINILGLFNLDSMANVEVNFRSCLPSNRKKCPIQGLYRGGIFNIFLPGSKVPCWFSNKSIGSSISFTVPSSPPNLKIQGLNMCCVYALYDIQKIRWPFNLFAKINNKSKGLKWIYSPGCYGIPEDGKDMIWLSHWKFKNDQLKGGDEVNVSIVPAEDAFQVVECGINLVHEQEENKDTQHNSSYTSWTYAVGGGLSTYQARKRGYLKSYQSLRWDYDWTGTDWYKNIFEESEEPSDQEN